MFRDKFNHFLDKLQNLPEKTKKVILWIAVIIIGLSLFIWWTKNLQEKIKTFQEEPFLLEELGGAEIKERIEGLENITDEIIEQGEKLMNLGEELLEIQGEEDIETIIKKLEQE